MIWIYVKMEKVVLTMKTTMVFYLFDKELC